MAIEASDRKIFFHSCAKPFYYMKYDSNNYAMVWERQMRIQEYIHQIYFQKNLATIAMYPC